MKKFGNIEVETMEEPINRIRAKNFRAASDLKRRGYKTAVHALPSKVRARLDQMLSWRVSAETALKALCSEYPKVRLPSEKTVRNYRDKYFKPTLTKALTKITNKEIQMDFKKQRIEGALADSYLIMATVLLPALESGALAALDQARQINLPIKAALDWVIAYKDVMKELREFARGNDMRLFVEEETAVGVQSDERNEDTHELFERILKKRGFQLALLARRRKVEIQQGNTQVSN